MIQQTRTQTLPKNYAPLAEPPPTILHGDGLTLRAGTHQEIATYHRLDSDPKLTKYLTLSRQTPLEKYPELLDWITKSFNGTFPQQPLFSWLIELPSKAGDYAGVVEASVTGENTLVIGCVVDTRHQRTKLSSRACRTLLQWATSLPGIEEIQGLCHPRNLKAQNLMRSLGMQNIRSRVTPERFTFPNYYPENSYALERSQMQVWQLVRDQNGAWPPSALPSSLSLNTSITNPTRSQP
jgi:RimJ/RimL family protein N-acetyltransferase